MASLRNYKVGQGQWLTPIILATWKAEIRRVTVGGQSRQKVRGVPSQPIKAGCGGMHLPSQLCWKCIYRKVIIQLAQA
jgi:hypothetical protein